MDQIDQYDLSHNVRLHKPDSTQKAEAEEMIGQFITRGRPYADFYYEQRRNIRVGDFVFEQDSLRIGIVDWDVNGVFNDLGADRIVIGEFEGIIKGTDEASGAVVLETSTYFHGTTYAFEVLEVSPGGKTIRIQPTLSGNVENRITEGQSIPDYSFELLSGEETSIHEYLDGQKFLFLNFWATWCAGCHQEIDDLKKIQSDYFDQITLVSLNYNEDIERIESFFDRYDVDWLNGYSTPEINEELFIYGLPRNILVDSTGAIVEMNIHPKSLLAQISTN